MNWVAQGPIPKTDFSERKHSLSLCRAGNCQTYANDYVYGEKLVQFKWPKFVVRNLGPRTEFIVLDSSLLLVIIVLN